MVADESHVIPAPARALPGLVLRRFGQVDYDPTWHAMQRFTAERDSTTPDELWLLEHAPIYTLGQAGKPEHLLRDNGIPVVRIDRGGQITYHGPGQLVAYLLIDLPRRRLRVGELVFGMEQAVIDLLAGYGIVGLRRPGAPGVYVDGAKIAALGLRVRRGCSYHGLALNVAMDLSPFEAINPCGYRGLRVTQLADLGVGDALPVVADRLALRLQRMLNDDSD